LVRSNGGCGGFAIPRPSDGTSSIKNHYVPIGSPPPPPSPFGLNSISPHISVCWGMFTRVAASDSRFHTVVVRLFCPTDMFSEKLFTLFPSGVLPLPFESQNGLCGISGPLFAGKLQQFPSPLECSPLDQVPFPFPGPSEFATDNQDPLPRYGSRQIPTLSCSAAVVCPPVSLPDKLPPSFCRCRFFASSRA